MTALSCGLRFWQLGRFNELVFDEIYFVQFAQNYLLGIASFDAHPPLGKYLIAVGIWLHRHSADAAGYRWMNALVGSGVPLLAMGLSHTVGCSGKRQETRIQEARLRTFALLSGVFMAIDGLFVVESRYGLINIYMVLLGLLGQWLWLLRDERELPSARDRGAKESRRQMVLGVLSGLCLGGAIATKWNGMGFTLSLFIWELFVRGPFAGDLFIREPGRKRQNAWQETASTVVSLFFYLIVVSGLFYWIIWLPHLWLSGESFGATHSQLLSFHQRLSSDGHAACSRWFTWPLLIKPIAYWYEEKNGLAYTVNNLGNPALWWLSSAVMLLISIDRLRELSKRIGERCARTADNLRQDTKQDRPAEAVVSFCLISYAANWLPWLIVDRCTFIYLYMPAAVFSFMALAWVMSGWLHSPKSWVRTMGWGVGIVIALAFLFWLPLSIGSPLSAESLSLRWWLRSWI